VAHMVRHLSSKCEALGSNSSAGKKKKRNSKAALPTSILPMLYLKTSLSRMGQPLWKTFWWWMMNVHIHSYLSKRHGNL
jgi:hypothetical protein